MTVFEAFPARPLKLTGYGESVGFFGWMGLIVIGVFCFIPVSGLLFQSSVHLADDFRLHGSGEVARESGASNYSARTKTAEAEFDLRYVTQQGTVYQRHVSLFPILLPPDRSERLVVRYDPAAPGHFSTNWGAQRLIHRTLLLLAMAIALAFVLAAGVRFISNRMRSGHALAAIVAEPQPTAATLVEITRAGLKWRLFSYTWTAPSGILRSGSKEIYISEEPFWLNAQKSQLLILTRSGDSLAVVLDSRLSWISLTEAERARIFAARDQAMKPDAPTRVLPTAAESIETMPTPSQAPFMEVAPEASSPLRDAAVRLSAALNETLSGLLANTSNHAADAQAVAVRLEPYVKEYDRAVFVERSRELASEVLSELIRSGAADNASVQLDPRDESSRPIDYGVGKAVGRYRALTTIFRETQYRDDLL